MNLFNLYYLFHRVQRLAILLFIEFCFCSKLYNKIECCKRLNASKILFLFKLFRIVSFSTIDYTLKQELFWLGIFEPLSLEGIIIS